MDKIALCLLTCDRPEITKRTVESLKSKLDLDQFILLHGDDCSSNFKNHIIAQDAGFKTVLKTKNRQGVSRMWQSLIFEAARHGATWVLMQENDWEWDKTFNINDIQTMLLDETVYYIRLFGNYKERNTRPCGTHHAAKNMKNPDWKPYIDGWEIGDIHWGFPPNLTRIKEAVKLTDMAKTESDCRVRSGKIKKLCVRPLENYVYHIGEKRTEGFKS